MVARTFRRVALVAALLSVAPAALAQMGEWYISGSAVYNDDDPDRKIDDGLSGIQFNVGRDFGKRFAVEGVFGYSYIDGFYLVALPDTYIRGSESQIELGANVLAYYKRDARFAPYLIAGFGYHGADLKDVDYKENNPTASLGIGFELDVGENPWTLRTEARWRGAFEDNDRVWNDIIATIGLQYRFGKPASFAAAGPSANDTDNDGVIDAWDDCPNTTPGAYTDARGCERPEENLDGDGDRVPDSRDECPNTPIGAPVDMNGCSLDSDMDGVLTGKDLCPGTRPGAIVDATGCELRDDDNDNVPNPSDKCPNTRKGANVDERGCEIREVISLPGVNFQSGSDLLVSGAERLVQEAANTLKSNPGWLIEVAGHTDSVGDEIDNQGLSDRRAKTVYDFLIKYGVEEERLTFKGYGESEPIASNDSPSGRAMNRRVELRVAKR